MKPFSLKPSQKVKQGWGSKNNTNETEKHKGDHFKVTHHKEYLEKLSIASIIKKQSITDYIRRSIELHDVFNCQLIQEKRMERHTLGLTDDAHTDKTLVLVTCKGKHTGHTCHQEHAFLEHDSTDLQLCQELHQRLTFCQSPSPQFLLTSHGVLCYCCNSWALHHSDHLFKRQ